MKKASALIGLIALTGCTVFHSTTRTYDDAGKLIGTTHATIATVFDSKSELTKFRNQSAKSGSTNNIFSPGTSVAALSQESSGATNLVNVIQAVAQGVAAGLK